jgi:hypothetical protein
MFLRRLLNNPEVLPLPPVEGGRQALFQPMRNAPQTPRYMTDFDLPVAQSSLTQSEPPELRPVPSAADAASMAMDVSTPAPPEAAQIINRLDTPRVNFTPPALAENYRPPVGDGGIRDFLGDRMRNIRNFRQSMRKNFVNPYRVFPGMGIPTLPVNNRNEELDEQDYIERDSRRRNR